MSPQITIIFITDDQRGLRYEHLRCLPKPHRRGQHRLNLDFEIPTTPQPKNLGVWAANLQNLKTQRLEPQSRLLAGTLENLPKEKKEPLKSEKRTQTCPTFWLCHVWIVTQSSHDCILLANVWWLSYHYRIIIWSRLDVIKKDELSFAASIYLYKALPSWLRWSFEEVNVCFRKQR